MSSLSDQLEIEFGTIILSGLIGHPLTRNQQNVRLFDLTKRTAEYYYRADKQGKPYIQDHALNKRYYPITAYSQFHKLDFAMATYELARQYGLSSLYSTSIKSAKIPIRSRPNQSITLSKVSVDYLPMALYQQSRTHFENNGLYQYLCQLFDKNRANYLFGQYQLGTSRHWKYENTLSTCLPQLDKSGNLRQVKVIPFHPQTGRRAKDHQEARRLNTSTGEYEIETDSKVWFAGKTLAKTKTIQLKQCFFGEHLLGQHPNKPVALVEGESTAIVCSAYWPQYNWLATGGSSGCRWYESDVIEVLKGYEVVIWPDTGKYTDWSSRVIPFQNQGYRLSVSRYVEDNAPVGVANLDLRDLLTGPQWLIDNKLIFGEELQVSPCDTYPSSWD